MSEVTQVADPVHEARLRLMAATRWLDHYESHIVSDELCCDAARLLATEALTWLRMAES